MSGIERDQDYVQVLNLEGHVSSLWVCPYVHLCEGSDIGDIKAPPHNEENVDVFNNLREDSDEQREIGERPGHHEADLVFALQAVLFDSLVNLSEEVISFLFALLYRHWPIQSQPMRSVEIVDIFVLFLSLKTQMVRTPLYHLDVQSIYTMQNSQAVRHAILHC